MAAYRRLFPGASITPKMHLLENHATEQLGRFRVGFGLLNEQGGELIHAHFNRTNRAVSGMTNRQQRLMVVMKRHHIATTPEVRSKLISCKKQKKEE